VGKMTRGIAAVILLAGIAVLAYPRAAQWRYERTADAEISEFEREISRAAEREPILFPSESADDDIISDETRADSGERADVYGDSAALQGLRDAIEEYNREIFENGQANLRDAFSYETAAFDLTEWGFGRNVIGYVDIPRMRVRLPIYLGATQENLRKGAGHLTQTSLPVGGAGTNCVLAAHRGMNSAAMFRDIEKLQIGDEITITSIWETLTYEVAEIKVIEPTDIGEILIREGKDLVTLITCHPYGRNTQRYAVYCERREE